MNNSDVRLVQIKKTILKDVIKIDGIHAFFYHEHPKNFVFNGERHDFWELLYVDKGEVEVIADTKGYKLQKGDVIFHKPKEFHSIWANKEKSPNVAVVLFASKSEAMGFFEDKIFRLSDHQHELLSRIIKSVNELFSGFGGNSGMLKKEDIPFGAEQLLKNYLEIILIDLVRNGMGQNVDIKLHGIIKEHVENDIINNITLYMQNNIHKNLVFQDICKVSMVNEAQLKAIFREKMGIAIMRYFKKMKIEEAKRIIRDETCNITQIAQRLGYSSIHHFSRVFKEVTDMTPTEYTSSVKARI